MKRSEIVAFMGIGSGEALTYTRMKGFTEMSVSKNPKEYSRKYVDEDSERTDVTGYSHSMSYKLDYDPESAVHTKLKEIADRELTGSAAVVSIIVVDLSKPATDGGSDFKAIKRDFAVVPSGEADDADTYTISGDFKASGEKVFGTASTTDEWQTATFAAEE